MIVIVSDLHLTDGTSGATIADDEFVRTLPPGAFRVFRQHLRDLAYNASWRRPDSPGDGPYYEPIDQFDLILLGDVLDVMRSEKWLCEDEGGVRPWDAGSGPQKREALERKVGQIVRSILERNEQSLGVLRGLSVGQDPKGWITLAPATEEGKPDDTVGWRPEATGRQRVRARIHYMIGNHEWPLCLPGQGYDAIRAEIKREMGLTNAANVPFPHDQSESETLDEVLREHGVVARHGDIFDPFNYVAERGRNYSSLGDAIVIDLISRFPREVKKLGGLIPPTVSEGLKEIDNVRPHTILPVWITGLLRRAGADDGQKKRVEDVWNRLVDAFFEIPFVRGLDSPWNWLDEVDQLQLVLKISKSISLSVTSALVNWFSDKLPGLGSSSYRDALEESDFKEKRARFFVHGHTHHHEIVPLDVSISEDGAELRQIYLNSGTWRRVHELAKYKTGEQEFVEYNVMSYLAFFKGNERRGRTFEAWSGALAV